MGMFERLGIAKEAEEFEELQVYAKNVLGITDEEIANFTNEDWDKIRDKYNM